MTVDGEVGTRLGVALLDLHARADQFQGDASLGTLAAEIEADGHRVVLVRSVLSEDPRGAGSWHARLGAFLRDGEFDLAVLVRVWDEATIDVIRRSLRTGGRVVRITSGVVAALDARLDHVVDLEGFRKLMAGDAAPPTAAWHPVRPAELRRRAAQNAPRLDVIKPLALPGLEASEVNRRPTISGPASGCPFLLDASKNPIFARLGADPTVVQMRGCTFCLDNTGSFAVPSETAVLDAWLSQLRRIREVRPAAREVLLTDERPYPYLPAFFRALRDDPSIGATELLFKSRVDWLLEFADTALAEAAALAEQSGSVLHLYLIGFENFDQFHLDLFNKGVTVADNVAALEKVRALAARFPRSFEYLRYRAHGIVLFTPWTRPEALLENARVMREIGFDALRSEAIRTRLRLYPRVPLHALAAHDGLLVSSFDAGRPDRAAEQGYDASVPWRFQDPRTEAIFQAASGLARACSLPDADVLEIATRFVLRFADLATVPDVAALPLRQALRAWGGVGPNGFVGLDAALIGFDPEIELLSRGIKRACLKEAVPRDDAMGLCRAYRAMGLAADIVEFHGLEQGRDAHVRGGDFAIVAVAADAAALEEVLTAQRAHGAVKSRAAVEAMGALMGYPPCCVAAFIEQQTRGDNVDNERLTFRRAPSEALHPLLHRVGGVRLLSHHPCTPSCTGSIRIAETIASVLEAIDPPAAARALEKLARPVLFLDYQRRLELQGSWDGDRFRVDSALALDEPRHLGLDPSEIAAIEVSVHAVRFALRDGTHREISVANPLLTSPGAPIAQTALAAIGGAIGPSAIASHSAAPPTLPDAFRPGVRVREYQIESIQTRGGAREVTLASAQHRFSVRVRAHDPARPCTVRRGAWAIDVDRPEELPESARFALRVLVGALGR